MVIAVVVGCLVWGGIHSPGAWAQDKVITVKIQASWPSGLTLYDNLKMFASSVEKMSGGQLKIEHLPAGAIVGAFEVLDAVSRGVVDGGHTASIHEPAPMGELMFNKDVWDKLSAHHQEIIKVAARDTAMRWFVWFHRTNAEAYKEMTEKHGVQVYRTPDDIIMTLLKTWDKIAAREAEKDPFFKKVLESQRAYASLLVPYRLSTWPAYEMAGNHYWKEAVFGKKPE